MEFPIDLQKKNSLSSSRQQQEAAWRQRQAPYWLLAPEGACLRAEGAQAKGNVDLHEAQISSF